MQADYQPFIDRVIHNYEGGYGWNKRDPGGPTKYGITCYDLAEHRGKRMDSMTRWAPIVRAMELPEAEAIYQKKYAIGVLFSSMAPGIDCCTLDYAINSGVSRANLVYAEIFKQKLPNTPAEVINAMCDERLRFMHSIRGGRAWAEFGHGWSARVTDLRQYCIALTHYTPAPGDIPAAPVGAPPPDLTKVLQPKAIHVPKTAGPITGGGAAGGAVATHVAGFHWPEVAAIGMSVLAIGIIYEAWSAGAAAKANATVHL